MCYIWMKHPKRKCKNILKIFQHPIQSNESRKKKIEDSGVADSEHIFVRESAKKRYRKNMARGKRN